MIISKQLRAAFMGWVVVALLAGCSSLSRLPLFAAQASPTSKAPAGTLPSPAAPAPAPAQTKAAPPAVAGPQVIVLWLPPQFDPSGTGPAARLLKDRLNSFMDQNPDVEVQVRIKAASGPGSLLESLSAASAAAPNALPSLIALSRSDLETAALKGLIFPLDSLVSKSIDDVDWYTYARQAALIQGSTFGMPFAGDALLLVYRTAHVNQPTDEWAGILRQGQPVALPAADPQALLTLDLYQALGGTVADAQGRPVLQPEILAQVLKLYSDASKQGVFPAWLAQYQTDGQAWQAYHEQSAQWLVTWSSHYLAELPADSTAMQLPSLGTEHVSLATSWLWALSDPLPERRGLAVRLAEYLVQGDFLANWTAAAGYLPTRPTALAMWPNQGIQSMLSQIVLSAQLRPNNDLTSSLGPVLADATLQVIKQQTDPVQAAQAAAERLATSTTSR
jgi:multiple sugar transport system substrate-binding protein